MLHLIPDDGRPHAPTSECGCGPQIVQRYGRRVYAHTTPDDGPDGGPPDEHASGEDDGG